MTTPLRSSLEDELFQNSPYEGCMIIEYSKCIVLSAPLSLFQWNYYYACILGMLMPILGHSCESYLAQA